jgi:hypothetical protein
MASTIALGQRNSPSSLARLARRDVVSQLAYLDIRLFIRSFII